MFKNGQTIVTEIGASINLFKFLTSFVGSTPLAAVIIPLIETSVLPIPIYSMTSPSLPATSLRMTFFDFLTLTSAVGKSTAGKVIV